VPDKLLPPAARQQARTIRLTRRDLESPAVPIVCVDLNGVLDRYKGWKHSEHWDPPRAGAERFLHTLVERGFSVVVFTTRHPVSARRWLREHGLMRYVSAVTNRKPAAHVFVDDRAVCFTGDFDATLQCVLAFKAHWEAPGAGQDTSARKRRTNQSRRTAKRRPSSNSPSD
jgi:hypothetical protein